MLPNFITILNVSDVQILTILVFIYIYIRISLLTVT